MVIFDVQFKELFLYFWRYGFLLICVYYQIDDLVQDMVERGILKCFFWDVLYFFRLWFMKIEFNIFCDKYCVKVCVQEVVLEDDFDIGVDDCMIEVCFELCVVMKCMNDLFDE